MKPKFLQLVEQRDLLKQQIEQGIIESINTVTNTGKVNLVPQSLNVFYNHAGGQLAGTTRVLNVSINNGELSIAVAILALDTDVYATAADFSTDDLINIMAAVEKL